MHIVIGSSLSALIHARSEETILLSCNTSPPFFLEDSFKEWNSSYLDLNLSGKVWFNRKIKSIFVYGDHVELLLSSHEKRKMYFDSCDVYGFDNVFFEDFHFLGEEERYLVYDWFKINSLGVHDLKDIDTKNRFIRRIWFPSKTEIVCKSILTKEEIYDIEYSDTYCRFGLLNLFRSMGLEGRKNGRNIKGTPVTLGLDLESTKREIVLQRKEKYKNIPKVTFHDTEWQ
jgi:hypothetical protein